MVSSSHFATTRWSVVRQAGQLSSDDQRAALETLCQHYWFPLYSYARRHTGNTADAEDSVQAFFVELLDKNIVGKAQAERGRFRAFLITAFKNFQSRQREKQQAQKRGGGQRILSIDFQVADSKYKLELATQLTAEQIFHRTWANTLLERVLGELQREMDLSGKSRQFKLLRPFIIGDVHEQAGHQQTYAEVAGQLGCTAAAAKMSAHRLRKRYREILRQEVAHTVDNPEEIEGEIRALFAVFQN